MDTIQWFKVHVFASVLFVEAKKPCSRQLKCSLLCARTPSNTMRKDIWMVFERFLIVDDVFHSIQCLVSILDLFIWWAERLREIRSKNTLLIFRDIERAWFALFFLQMNERTQSNKHFPSLNVRNGEFGSIFNIIFPFNIHIRAYRAVWKSLIVNWAFDRGLDNCCYIHMIKCWSLSNNLWVFVCILYMFGCGKKNTRRVIITTWILYTNTHTHAYTDRHTESPFVLTYGLIHTQPI